MSDSRRPLGIARRLDDIGPEWAGCVLTIGNFDGVHVGHQTILQRCAALAAPTGAPVVAMTFEPHPIAILAPNRAPEPLTCFEQKAHLLRHSGADGVVVVTVNHAFLGITAEEFVREIVVESLHPAWIVEGPDFGFGRGRRGDLDLLRELGRPAGYQVDVVEPIQMAINSGRPPMVVSSSGIRALLRAGDVATAAKCLGRAYAVIGHVAQGAGVGRTLGYPTVNLEGVRQLIPQDGVYAGVTTLGPSRLPAAISIGRRETFDGQTRVVEAFLLDAAGDWYGETLELSFVARLRGQQRFDSPTALAEQIGRDVACVRERTTGSV